MKRQFKQRKHFRQNQTQELSNTAVTVNEQLKEIGMKIIEDFRSCRKATVYEMVWYLLKLDIVSYYHHPVRGSSTGITTDFVKMSENNVDADETGDEFGIVGWIPYLNRPIQLNALCYADFISHYKHSDDAQSLIARNAHLKIKFVWNGQTKTRWFRQNHTATTVVKHFHLWEQTTDDDITLSFWFLPWRNPMSIKMWRDINEQERKIMQTNFNRHRPYLMIGDHSTIHTADETEDTSVEHLPFIKLKLPPHNETSINQPIQHPDFTWTNAVQSLKSCNNDQLNFLVFCYSNHLLTIESLQTYCNPIALIIQGKAGSGKSFAIDLLNKLIELIEKETTTPNRSPIICSAHQGIAADNIGGVTLYTLFQQKVQENPNIIFSDTFRYGRIASVFAQTKWLIIDEAPSVNNQNMSFYKKILIDLGQTNTANSGWGSQRIIWLGDVAQIPPVQALSCVSNRILMNSMIIQEWSTGMRQSNSPDFLKMLDALIEGTSDCDQIDRWNALRVPINWSPPTKNITGIFYNNRAADIFNDVVLQKFFPYYDIIHATFTHSYGDGKTPHNIPIKLKVYPGVKLMCLVNLSTKHKLMNGSICHFQKYVRGHFIIKNSLNENVSIPKGRYNEMGYKNFQQYPFRPAYGLTCHKCQGLTIKHDIFIDATGFSRNMLYVAASRVETIDQIHIINLSQHLFEYTTPVKQLTEFRQYYNSQPSNSYELLCESEKRILVLHPHNRLDSFTMRILNIKIQQLRITQMIIVQEEFVDTIHMAVETNTISKRKS